MHRKLILSVVGLGGLAVAAAVQGQQAASSGKPVKPLVWWSGPDSAVKAPEFAVIRGKDQWLEAWARHAGRAAAMNHYSEPMSMPVVDFDACMVVAVFLGSKWNSDGAYVASIIEEKDAVRFRFDERTYQTMGPDGGGVKVKPYGLFVLPKIEKPVVIEENVQGLKNQPEKWRERGRFDPKR